MSRIFAFPAGYVAAVSVRSGLAWLARSLDFGGAISALFGLAVSAFLGGLVLALVWRQTRTSAVAHGVVRDKPNYSLFCGGLLGVVLFALERLTFAPAAWSMIAVGNGLVTCIAATAGAWTVRDRLRLS